jgi:hypothetical protein
MLYGVRWKPSATEYDGWKPCTTEYYGRSTMDGSYGVQRVQRKPCTTEYCGWKPCAAEHLEAKEDTNWCSSYGVYGSQGVGSVEAKEKRNVCIEDLRFGRSVVVDRSSVGDGIRRWWLVLPAAAAWHSAWLMVCRTHPHRRTLPVSKGNKERACGVVWSGIHEPVRSARLHMRLHDERSIQRNNIHRRVALQDGQKIMLRKSCVRTHLSQLLRSTFCTHIPQQIVASIFLPVLSVRIVFYCLLIFSL